MKIFDGLEEIDIVPWYECKECSQHSPFLTRLSALNFLQRFATFDATIDSFRRLIREKDYGALQQYLSKEKVLNQVAQMLATGELHLTRKRTFVRTEIFRFAARAGRPEPGPGPVRPPSSIGPASPPPDESVFLSNVDPGAIAQALAQASLSGLPFCDE
jgi:hypothetical protein